MKSGAGRIQGVLQAFLLAVFEQGASALPVDAQVASVNGETISVSDVMRELPSVLRSRSLSAEGSLSAEDAFRAAFREALDALIDRTLVLQKYWAGEQRLPAHAIDRTTAEIIEDRYGGNLQNLLSDLAAERMTYAEWRDKMQERLIVASMRHSFADGLAHVSPSEIAAAYEAEKARFAKSGSMDVRLAVFSGPEAQEKASAVLAECSEKGTAAVFDTIESDSSPKCSVQDLSGINPEADLAPAIAEAVAKISDGEVSGPVSLGESVFLVFRKSTATAGYKPLSEVWDELRSAILAKKKDALFKSWTGHLRSDAVIVKTLPWDREL